MTKKTIISTLFVVCSLLLVSAFAGNALFDASIRTFDKNLAQFDKELKNPRYGNKRWEKKLQGKKERLVKSIKKTEKKFPKEDVAFLWEKLDQHTKEFNSKVNNPLVTSEVIITKLKPNKKNDVLYKAAVKSLESKLARFEKLVAKKDYKRTSWVSSVERDNNKLLNAIDKMVKDWPKKDTNFLKNKLSLIEKEFAAGAGSQSAKSNNNLAKNNNKAKHRNNLKIIQAKFERLDSYMKQNGYGESTWDRNLKSHATSLVKSIKVIEKDLPAEAKTYFNAFQQRVAVIKVKNKQAQEKAKMAALQTKQKKEQEKRSQNTAKKHIAASTKTVSKESLSKALLQKVMKEQQAYVTQGKMEIWDNSTGNIKRSGGESAYLSFTSDYAKSTENKNSFTGKEFIYAHLHLPKNLSDLLPKENAKGLQYYRVIIIATVKSDSKYSSDKTQKNGNKLKRIADFKLGYTTNNLSIAIVPERGFFENILDKYRSGDKFSDNKTKEQALSDLLSRNFSRQLSLLFKKLPVGSHQVNVEFQVTAKLSQEKYYELKNMKGTFLLNVDQEAKERYKNTFDMLSKLYRTYESEHNVAVGSLDLDAEKKKLAAMSPMKRECYHLAKRSPEGFMACYKGEKSEISFHIGKARSKAAFIDIVWPKGSCEKCMAGSEGGFKIRKNAVKKIKIPNGAKVSINGRTLIQSVSSKKDVTLYWYY